MQKKVEYGRTLLCRCGKKMIVMEVEKARVFLCPSYDLKETHDLVLIKK